MTPKVLSILIIGGQASAGIGLESMLQARSGSYVPQLVRQLQYVGWKVQIECHAPVDIDVAQPLLCQLNLNRFDLILLELGHARLQHPPSFGTLLRAHNYDPFDPKARILSVGDIATRCSQNRISQSPVKNRLVNTVLDYVKLATLQLLSLMGRIGRVNEVNEQLTDLLYYLQPYRRRLVLMTPLPHPQLVANWLRQKGQQLFWHHGRRNMIPVFDTTTVLGTGEEFFTTNQEGNLSPVAGDLLGQTLYDYIQNNALLPARPELRQRRGY
jgi:hypothetical protein